eukprot:7391868-Prymnesium_polylepis.5
MNSALCTLIPIRHAAKVLDPRPSILRDPRPSTLRVSRPSEKHAPRGARARCARARCARTVSRPFDFLATRVPSPPPLLPPPHPRPPTCAGNSETETGCRTPHNA